MKLKKLLPLAGMTGVATIAAPLVTSCAQKGTEIVWNKGDSPLIESIGVKTFASWKEATEAYFNAIDEDHTLLSKDIATSDSWGTLLTDVNKITVRTDKVDKEHKKISYASKVEGKIYIPDPSDPLDPTKRIESKGTFEYEAKNAEFCITYDTIDGERIVYLQPTLTKEIEMAYYAVLAQDDDEIARTVAILTNHAEELSKDNSWYFYASEDTEVSKTTQRVDASNVYEYAHEVLDDYSISLSGFVHLTTYFADIDVTE